MVTRMDTVNMLSDNCVSASGSSNIDDASQGHASSQEGPTIARAAAHFALRHPIDSSNPIKLQTVCHGLSETATQVWLNTRGFKGALDVRLRCNCGAVIGMRGTFFAERALLHLIVLLHNL